MGKCLYCEADNNDFILLNQTSEYSGVEMALNRQGMLRIRCHWDSDEGAATQDVIELHNCPSCGKRFTKKKYRCGLYIGRFQPLHIGHTRIISKMLDECEDVIIAIGSAQESGTERNPLSFAHREELIMETFFWCSNNMKVIPLKDRENPSDDASWGDYVFARVKEWCKLTPDVIYEGEESERTHWYDNLGVEVVRVPRSILPISGTMLRDAIVRDDKDVAFQYMPTAIREYYNEIRKAIRKCKG